MLFSTFCEFLERIENITSRNEMTSILQELFSNLNMQESQIVSYLLDGRLAPNFVNSEFGMSEKLLIKVAQRISKRDILSLRDSLGDIGLVFYEILENEVSIHEDIFSIYTTLWEIVNTKGQGSVEQKILKSYNLLHRLSALEAKYVSRIITGTLRLGSSVKTLLDAFSFIISGSKSIRDSLDRAYGVSADIGYIASLVKTKNPVNEIASVVPITGVPILSRLVQRAKSFEEVTERMGDSYFVQPKFDGLRLQIHKNIKGFENSYKQRIWYKYIQNNNAQTGLFNEKVQDTVRLFTRNLEDVTIMFPEIVQSANKLKCESCILDGEVIGWDEKENHFKSYQDTMTRKRKYDVSTISKEIPVKTFVFDLMHLDNVNLIDIDTQKRISKLTDLVGNGVQDIVKAQNLELSSTSQLKNEFNKWVEEGLEGLIAKKKEGGYTPGGRDYDWIKLKRSFMSELNDSVDVVVLGYYKGSGKRAKFGMGALLCGIYNSNLDRFESLTKLGTGVTDELWGEISKQLKPLELKEKPKNVEVSSMLIPDVWVFPKIVCTVEADDITKSIKQEEDLLSGGLSMRFPRLIEFGRDKDPFDTTTVSELIEMAK